MAGVVYLGRGLDVLARLARVAGERAGRDHVGARYDGEPFTAEHLDAGEAGVRAMLAAWGW